jgi:hypothetical protein
MTRTTLIDNDFITLYFHEDDQIIHHVYKNGIHGDYLKDGLNAGTDKLIETGAVKWLSDNRAIEGVTNEESAWINEVWLPRTIEAGWKFWALVVPENVMGQMNMIQFVNSFAEKGVKVMVFTDDDNAMTWLTGIDKGSTAS